MSKLEDSGSLKRELKLFDVFSISTGAMFSSGFFLLPGIAAVYTGPSVMFAYLLASLIMIPPMLSMAELSTAMPKSGGNYYFLDRALGPLVGTIGGMGEWLVLSLKSAFALIGMGAYIGIYFDIPIVPLAIALTVAFTLLNTFGAKESGGLQRFLVAALVLIMSLFVVQGIWAIAGLGFTEIHTRQFVPLFTDGLSGLLATVGLVFVSYSGLTKVASVSEEIQNPDRNIPLGMILSLSVTTLIYVVGVYVMVALLPAESFRGDLTPVATAGKEFMDWIPYGGGVFLIVVAAIAAFASTGNAGILSASRFPMAMSRDNLIWSRFKIIGKYNTPTVAIATTGGLIILSIILLDVESVAKLASSFQLLTFGLICFALIVMRQSGIRTYRPGFISPFYPWIQIIGIIASIVLIIEIGLLSMAFTSGLVLLCVIWYFYFAHDKVVREGAIYHVFAKLGERRFEGLDYELRDIMKSRNLEDGDHYEEIIARSTVIDLKKPEKYSTIIKDVSKRLSEYLPYTSEELTNYFKGSHHIGETSVSKGVAMPDLRLPKASHIIMVLIRGDIFLDLYNEASDTPITDQKVKACIFLISPVSQTGQHLRILAEIVSRVDDDEFLDNWEQAESSQELQEIMLRNERFLNVLITEKTAGEEFAGKKISELVLPSTVLIALINRSGKAIIPRGNTELKIGDRVTLVGEPSEIKELYKKYPAIKS